MAEETNVRASLGCGTLILIAIIVALFGGQNDHDKLGEKIDRLQREVSELRAELKGDRAIPAELPKPETQ